MTDDSKASAAFGTAAVGQDRIIRTTNLHKTYDTGEVQVHALRGIDLEVSRGEMVAVMGPAGDQLATVRRVRPCC